MRSWRFWRASVRPWLSGVVEQAENPTRIREMLKKEAIVRFMSAVEASVAGLRGRHNWLIKVPPSIPGRARLPNAQLGEGAFRQGAFGKRVRPGRVASPTCEGLRRLSALLRWVNGVGKERSEATDRCGERPLAADPWRLSCGGDSFGPHSIFCRAIDRSAPGLAAGGTSAAARASSLVAMERCHRRLVGRA